MRIDSAVLPSAVGVPAHREYPASSSVFWLEGTKGGIDGDRDGALGMLFPRPLPRLGPEEERRPRLEDDWVSKEGMIGRFWPVEVELGGGIFS